MSTADLDLVVVGAGPAGMAATATALAGGLQVALVDAGNAVGGQFWRRPPGDDRVADDLYHGLEDYRLLRSALDRGVRSGVLDLHLAHDVWTAERHTDGSLSLHAVDRSRPGSPQSRTIRARAVLLATGAYDRQLPFPGWDLPGVYTIGGLQALLKGGGVVAGQRIALGGTGPFLLPVATSLAERGADVVALCEASDGTGWARHLGAVLRNPAKALEGADYGARLVRHRVLPRPRTAIVAAEGTDRVEAVRIARLDAAGRVRPGTQRRLAADAVGVGWGFVPQLDLALTLGCRTRVDVDGNEVVAIDAHQRTSVPGVYVAGEACGVGGATLALREGQLAAEAVLADAGRSPATHAPRLQWVRRTVSAQRDFARAMHETHGILERWSEWLTPSTTICRCEEVSCATVRDAAQGGDGGHRQVKQVTRAGMGWCQGRMCGPAIQSLLDPARAYLQAERAVAVPVPLGVLTDAVPCDILLSSTEHGDAPESKPTQHSQSEPPPERTSR